MNTGWDYSDLVHTAKLSGGPEKYIGKLINYGVQEGIKKGHREMVPFLFISAVVGGGATYIGCKIAQVYKSQAINEIISKEEACEAGKQFVNEINKEIKKEDVQEEIKDAE